MDSYSALVAAHDSGSVGFWNAIRAHVIARAFREKRLSPYALHVFRFIVAGFIALLFGRVGEAGGCPPAIDGDFQPGDLDNATEHIKHQLEQTYNNNGMQV